MREWRAIPGWENYEVSSDGLIRSASTKRELSQIATNGYRSAVLYRRRWDYIHRMVLEAFVGPSPEGRPDCGHVNGNPADNRIENLRWVSASENGQDMILHGRSTRGSRNPQAKLTEEDVRAMRASQGSANALAKRYRVSPRTVRSILIGETWKHVTSVGPIRGSCNGPTN